MDINYYHTRTTGNHGFCKKKFDLKTSILKNRYTQTSTSVYVFIFCRLKYDLYIKYTYTYEN